MATEAHSARFRDLVPEDVVVERISDGHLFTEGPVWDARSGALLWVDIAGDTIWRHVAGVGRSVDQLPSGKANGLTFDRQGRLVVAGWTSRCVWRRSRDGSIERLVTYHDGVRIGTPNDIVVKSDGAIYWTDGTSGTRHPGFETAEDLQVYRQESVVMRLDPLTGETAIATTEAGSCNGLAFSPNESILYVNDSSARVINAFEVRRDGSLGPARPFAERTGSATKVDRGGNVFCTGGPGVQVFDPAGRLLGGIAVPEKGSNLAWGDADWRTLFVTAGTSVYRVRLTTQGLPVG